MLQVSAKVPGFSKVPFFIHTANDRYISARIRSKGAWEPFESTILWALLGPGDHVLDVGANIGWHTVSTALRVGPSGGVFAFEPDDDNFNLLLANIEVNHLTWVHAKKTALGRASGMATLTRSDDNLGDHRVRTCAADTQITSTMPVVNVMALDEYVDESPAFDRERLRVVKIDVQGFEAEVMLGAARLLASMRKRTAIFLEFDPYLLREQGHDACGELLDILAATKRTIFAIRRPVRRLERVTVAQLGGWASSLHAPSVDLILVDSSQVAELRAAVPWASRVLTDWR